jgi:SAM-dependent methyltransferase
MLDAGAGDSPYRDLFSHVTYEAADVCVRQTHDYQYVDYVCDLSEIPVPNDRYDFILCTQVLEHVPHPQKVLAEFHRVLKPGGTLWLSAPLSFEEHEIPYDFFRYTQYGFRSMMQEAGLDVTDIGWVQGYLGTLAYQLNLARFCLPSRPKMYGGGVLGWISAALSFPLRPLFLLLAIYFARLDLRAKYTGAGHCLDYYVIARKPQATA